MNHSLDCNIVRDLLPTYIERLTSKETDRELEAHLAGCPECRQYLRQMQEEVVAEPAPEMKEVKRVFSKTKKMYILKGLLYAIGICPILVSFIVNLAVSRCLSWFYIVTGGCLLGYSLLGILVLKKKNKIVSALICLSVLIIPYLAIIQEITNKYFLNKPIYWLWNIGIPITLIWLAIVWIVILGNKLLKINVLVSVGLLFLLEIPGNMVTNMLAGAYSIDNIFQMSIINNSVAFAVAIVLIVMGAKRAIAKKNSRN